MKSVKQSSLKSLSIMLFSLAILFTLTGVSLAANIYVPADYTTIQGAINASSSGDTVFISAGTYYENITISTDNITVTNDCKDVVIIDGGGNDRVVTMNGDSTLEGLIITNGYTASSGAGIYFNASTATVRDCEIYDNAANSGGGGIYAGLAYPTIIGCDIHDNTASNGAGISSSSVGTTIIDSSDIHDNTATSTGGGIYSQLHGNAVIIRNDSVVRNNVAAYGGGIYISGTQLTMTESDILDNYVVGTNGLGGGVYGSSATTMSFTECEIIGNQSYT
ncbi:nitrous oxide reductase family maturation protein NosD, partial [Thermodesulfobacteriota bacterium]